jgi:DNA-directed RNA polymerase II subunit RPB2
VQRPCFIVENNRLKIKKSDIQNILNKTSNFEKLMHSGLIEFLDVEEEETAMIAMTIDDLKGKKSTQYNFTHCEIHASMILGVCASIIPFPDHN